MRRNLRCFAKRDFWVELLGHVDVIPERSLNDKRGLLLVLEGCCDDFVS